MSIIFNKINLIVLISIIIIVNISIPCLCFPTGAPTWACADQKPGHGFPPQNSPSPYQLDVQPQQNGQSYKLTIKSSSGQTFRGFLIEARLVVGNGVGSQPVGRFESTNTTIAHTINCPGGQNNAITHSNPVDKHEIIVLWYPPPQGSTPGQHSSVRFVATVVKVYNTYWMNLLSAPIQLN
ncbi:putative defense protein 3 [Oppia nitens]|uniref:putative defense protein 3 n=1 Tax=Oppia nitens TaxID=1686743 RepID=UPI0023DA0037|nr:putative defense protein 3 [Oppia nitens]